MDKAPAWWVINNEDLMKVLHRAYNGEDPELLQLELYANSEIETVEGGEA